MKSILVLAAAALLFVPLSAQQNCDREKVREQAHAARSEMHEWFSKDVVPTLREWHNEFDETLSPENLATLQKLRAEAKQMKESIHAEMKEMRESASKDGDRHEMHEKMKAIKEQNHAKMESIIEQVRPIAQASKTELLALRDDNRDQIQAWKEKAREMMKESREKLRECAEEMDKKERKHMRKMMKHSNSPHEIGMLFEGGRKAALRFMLWDGSIPELQERADGITTATKRQHTLGSVKVSPNPGAATATVRMSQISGDVATIQVYDMNGSLVASASATVSSGRLNERIDTSKLTPGTYMVSVSTNSGRKTTTLVISQ